MSEHQFVAFRAIDVPVSEKNLEYMKQQSSRAEITPWSFDNEYHFGDFHGDAAEMLRRGYDLHLHYANFGIRKLMTRLPHGLPNPEAAQAYFEDDSLQFSKDRQGQGGILIIDPSYEPGQLDDLWDLGDLPDRLVPLRDEIQSGDLRPLYLAHLAIGSDLNHDPEETKEGPVPAGLNKLSQAQRALVEFYGMDEHLIAAAATKSPALLATSKSPEQYAQWLERQPAKAKDSWLARLLTNEHAAVRPEMLAAFRESQSCPPWPTNPGDRTVAALHTAGAALHEEAKQKAAESAARKRTRKLADMAADPMPTLRATEKLVAQRSSEAYHQVAELLSDLREALAACDQSALAEQQARKLKNNNPTLKLLTRELRRKGFVKN